MRFEWLFLQQELQYLPLAPVFPKKAVQSKRLQNVRSYTMGPGPMPCPPARCAVCPPPPKGAKTVMECQTGHSVKRHSVLHQGCVLSRSVGCFGEPLHSCNESELSSQVLSKSEMRQNQHSQTKEVSRNLMLFSSVVQYYNILQSVIQDTKQTISSSNTIVA